MECVKCDNPKCTSFEPRAKVGDLVAPMGWWYRLLATGAGRVIACSDDCREPAFVHVMGGSELVWRKVEAIVPRGVAG